MTTYYPSENDLGFVYYHADDSWWKRHETAIEGDRAHVTLLDVLFGVENTLRADVIATHTAAIANTIDRIDDATRNGRHDSIDKYADRLRNLAHDVASLKVGVAA